MGFRVVKGGFWVDCAAPLTRLVNSGVIEACGYFLMVSDFRVAALAVTKQVCSVFEGYKKRVDWKGIGVWDRVQEYGDCAEHRDSGLYGEGLVDCDGPQDCPYVTLLVPVLANPWPALRLMWWSLCAAADCTLTGCYILLLVLSALHLVLVSLPAAAYRAQGWWEGCGRDCCCSDTWLVAASYGLHRPLLQLLCLISTLCCCCCCCCCAVSAAADCAQGWWQRC